MSAGSAHRPAGAAWDVAVNLALAPMLSEMPIAAAIVPLEMVRSFEFIQLN
jgi:hypothetical protein